MPGPTDRVSWGGLRQGRQPGGGGGRLLNCLLVSLWSPGQPRCVSPPHRRPTPRCGQCQHTNRQSRKGRARPSLALAVPRREPASSGLGESRGADCGVPRLSAHRGERRNGGDHLHRSTPVPSTVRGSRRQPADAAPVPSRQRLHLRTAPVNHRRGLWAGLSSRFKRPVYGVFAVVHSGSNAYHVRPARFTKPLQSASSPNPSFAAAGLQASSHPETTHAHAYQCSQCIPRAAFS